MKLIVYRLFGGALLAALALLAMTLSNDTRLSIGISIAILSLVFLVLSRVHLGTSFAVKLEARELVTKGFYSKIQHPLYFFLDALLLGLIICFDMSFLLFAWVLLIVVHVLEARREEKLLQSAFGEKYTAYQADTWF